MLKALTLSSVALAAVGASSMRGLNEQPQGQLFLGSFVPAQRQKDGVCGFWSLTENKWVVASDQAHCRHFPGCDPRGVCHDGQYCALLSADDHIGRHGLKHRNNKHRNNKKRNNRKHGTKFDDSSSSSDDSSSSDSSSDSSSSSSEPKKVVKKVVPKKKVAFKKAKAPVHDSSSSSSAATLDSSASDGASAAAATTDTTTAARRMNSGVPTWNSWSGSWTPQQTAWNSANWNGHWASQQPGWASSWGFWTHPFTRERHQCDAHHQFAYCQPCTVSAQACGQQQAFNQCQNTWAFWN